MQPDDDDDDDDLLGTFETSFKGRSTRADLRMLRSNDSDASVIVTRLTTISQILNIFVEMQRRLKLVKVNPLTP